MITRILAHPVHAGWELRHEGCAPPCCEADAVQVPVLPSLLAIEYGDLCICANYLHQMPGHVWDHSGLGVHGVDHA